uniref:Ubiquitin n=1 Tax=Griffithsia japonica TaxID=83288 RepID=Q7XZ04_GRIJA|nr:ubiquitin [Griffithsia japonica]
MALSIKAKCFNGESYDLSVAGATPSVADLQQAIHSASGITPDRQTILFKGRVLEAGTGLSDYALSDGAIVSVVRRIGKAPPSSKPTSSSAPTSTPAAPTAAPPQPAASTPADGAADADADGTQPSLEEMIRALNMNAGAGGAPGGVPGAAGSPLAGLSSLLGNAGGARRRRCRPGEHGKSICCPPANDGRSAQYAPL